MAEVGEIVQLEPKFVVICSIFEVMREIDEEISEKKVRKMNNQSSQ